MNPFGTVAAIIETRLRETGRRFSLRAALLAVCVLSLLVCLGFGLAAATVALSARIGLLEALGVMAGGALAVALIVLGVLAIEARQARRRAALRPPLESELMRSVAFTAAAVPGVARLPSRNVLGLGLVAVGAALVLLRRRPARQPVDRR